MPSEAHVYVCVGVRAHAEFGRAGLSAGLRPGPLVSWRVNLDFCSLFWVDGIDPGGVKNQL